MDRRKQRAKKKVQSFIHEDASRPNIPSAEHQPVVDEDILAGIRSVYERRNLDLDPQLVWRGKEGLDLSDFVVNSAPIYIQERIHPKALIDNLMHHTSNNPNHKKHQIDMFANAFGKIDGGKATEFYQHENNWSNRMILGDSLMVMASMAEKERLRGEVQCIYLDPPYGIKFNSNFQWSTANKEVKDGAIKHITNGPEQVKAFRDTWNDGINSYLTYLRDRLLVARDLLSESGSIFMQIGDENVHRVRALMDEVFNAKNFVNQINCRTSSGTTRGNSLKRSCDYLLWYAKSIDNVKFRRLAIRRDIETKMYNQLLFSDLSTRPMSKDEKDDPSLIPKDAMPYRKLPLFSMSAGDHSERVAFGKPWKIPSNRSWRHSAEGFVRLLKAGRIMGDKSALHSRYFHSDYEVAELSDTWTDTGPEINKIYVVQTSEMIVQRAILMTTDPGDLVLDPTCGSGTSATVAEKWGRRWITIDTSRVALALARARIMGTRFPYFLLADSLAQRDKKSNFTRPRPHSAKGSIRYGFIYNRVPHVTLKSIANNTEIDTIWDRWQEKLEPLRKNLNNILGKSWQEWEIPKDPHEDWPKKTVTIHAKWWEARIMRQKEIDKSIAEKTDFAPLYDQPYEDNSIVRVAGPFTVESLAPHRTLALDGNQHNESDQGKPLHRNSEEFTLMVLDNLRRAGVQQANKDDKINFSSLQPWPGKMIAAEGTYRKPGSGRDDLGRRAAISIGPEFGTVGRADLVEAAKEAGEAGFDVLISCAFNYDAHSSEFNKLGRIPVLKSRMNADLHMADDLKNTGSGNLFVIFGAPDIEILDVDDDHFQIKINGVDVFHPSTEEIRSHGPDGIACWFVDTDYNEENFFVRQAYFPGTDDPYNQLKKSLKAEINEDAWDSLNRRVSLPFPKPSSGRIAVKAINHLGDEVMKVFRVQKPDSSPLSKHLNA